jgi:hypothetical protein
MVRDDCISMLFNGFCKQLDTGADTGYYFIYLVPSFNLQPVGTHIIKLINS